jgi:hypothetical protein
LDLAPAESIMDESQRVPPGRATVIDPAAALVAAKQVDEAVGLIDKMLAKLRTQPDLAALKLSTALDEIVKTYRVVDQAITDYGSLAIDDDGLRGGSRTLLAIAGGSLAVQVAEGRGHCGAIYLIYDKYLRRWFARVLNPGEQAEIRRVFMTLGDADNSLFRDLETIAGQLTDEATGVVDLVIAQRNDDAREQVLTAYRKLQPLQRRLSEGMVRLLGLKDGFAQVAGAV